MFSLNQTHLLAVQGVHFDSGADSRVSSDSHILFDSFSLEAVENALLEVGSHGLGHDNIDNLRLIVLVPVFVRGNQADYLAWVIHQRDGCLIGVHSRLDADGGSSLTLFAVP